MTNFEEVKHWWVNLPLKEINRLKPKGRNIEDMSPFEIKELYQQRRERMSVNTRKYVKIKVKPTLYDSRPIEGNVTTGFYHRLIDDENVVVEVIRSSVLSDFNPDDQIIEQYLKINYSIIV